MSNNANGNQKEVKGFKKANKRIALMLSIMMALGLVGCGKQASNTNDNTEESKYFYSSLSNEQFDEIADARYKKFNMDRQTYEDVVRFINSESMESKYAESEFMEKGYYTADYNSGLDRKTEAAIGVMSNTGLNDSDRQNPTDWVHRANEFEKGSYEYIFLKKFESQIDSVLEDPTNQQNLENLFEFIVRTLSEEDSELMIGDITANNVIRNSDGVYSIMIDEMFTFAYPAISQGLSGTYTVKNSDGEVILKNANPKQFMEEEAVMGCENTQFEKDDKQPDQTFDDESDPLNELVFIQNDYGKIRSR